MNAGGLLAALVGALLFATPALAGSAADGDLELAASFGDLDGARAALEAGANPNAVNSRGETMLEQAAIRSPDVVKLLLDHHAQVDARDSTGGTALLDCALYSGTGLYDASAVAELLIAAGADVNAKDNNGLTPLAAAAAVNNSTSQALQDLLRAHGATE